MSGIKNKKLRLPAEWEPQDAVMLTWPDEESNWGETIALVDESMANIAAEISRFERVLIACANPTKAAKLLENAGAMLENIKCYTIRSNDLWARDHGPITVYANGEARLLDFRFNGWGGKYPYDLDKQINQEMAECGAWAKGNVRQVHLTFEGGAVESDGQGTLMLNSQCVLHPSRNGAISQEDMEEVLREQLGAERFLWVHHGHLEGDDTDGHIDTLARFCSADTIAYTSCDNPDEPHFRQLQALESELKRLRSSSGAAYTLVPLPLPAPIFDEGGGQLPANYANFLIINGAVLVPVYADPQDVVAIERIGGLFPDRKVVPVDCTKVITQFGAVHCMSMQLPAGIANIGKTKLI